MEIHHGVSASSLSVPSPTFTSYSSENLGDIAARVVGELNLSIADPYDDDFYASLHQNDAVEQGHNHLDEVEEEVVVEEEDDDDGSEFEFAVLCREDDSSPISADEIFSNGQIRPMFPIFNTDLVFGGGEENYDVSQDPPERTIRLPLRKLLTKERENNAASCSSSEADELDGIPPGTYCVWTANPKKKENDIIGKKSHSTGSCSKRFRIRDLLYRSNSDGKDTFVFLTPSNHRHRHHHNGGGDQKRREKLPPSSAAAKKKGAGGGGNLEVKKKSYLPYRRDLVGISRTVRPF
ncbi:hypothetical protein Cgig2_030599 [Carnegiea gigantea]|uniref:Uncharacterized protein n=1 Tax=Carnegiea gigantea TaxID=171969 RepID=A0A9Q1GXI6_9CARY|nr:hypothetical protein Cgig2_030599 [Carnegiea gigantea]